MRRARWWFESLTVCALLSRQASAQQVSNEGEALEAVSIRVDGPPGCPTGQEFWLSLQRRAPGIRLTRPGEPGRVFLVRFQRVDSGAATGRIRILDVDGSALEREVNGGTCVEVAEALALIAAVGARGPLPDDAEPEEGPGRERFRRERPPPSAAGPAATRVVDADRAPEWSVLIRAQGSVRTQIVPTALYGAGAGFELARDGASLWQPAVGALVEATFTGTASTADVAANTEMTGQLTMVHVFASPLRLRAGPVDVRPYGSLDIGRLALRGQGGGLESPGRTQMFWFAAALFAQADLRLSPNWAVGAKLGAEVHPLLFEYQFTPRDVYQVGDVGLAAGVSASFRFD
jgi:hypothetical protein